MLRPWEHDDGLFEVFARFRIAKHFARAFAITAHTHTQERELARRTNQKGNICLNAISSFFNRIITGKIVCVMMGHSAFSSIYMNL